MISPIKLHVQHRKLIGRTGHVIEVCIIISVTARATNVPLDFLG